MHKCIFYFVYGVADYAVFFATFLYAVGFIGNLLVTVSIDGNPQLTLWLALVIDATLLGLFAIQHSVMAGPGFKRRWTKIVPMPIERSTYVLFSRVALIIMFVYWQPIGGTVWHVTDSVGQAVLWSAFGLGWLVVLVSTFMINHFDLFGLRQVWLQLIGKPYKSLPFVMPAFYRRVRHLIYVGFILAFWATPTMSVAHLVFAIATTAYILIAIQLEERDLVNFHPEYAGYRRQVPMLVPRLSTTRHSTPSVT